MGYLHHTQPVRHGGTLVPALGDDTSLKPQPMHLTEPLLQIIDRPKLPGKPHFPDSRRVFRHRLVQITGGQRQNCRQIRCRFIQSQPPDNIHVSIAHRYLQPAPLLQYRQQHGCTVIIKAVAGAPCSPTIGRRSKQSLNLRQHRPCPFHDAGHTGSRGPLRPAGQQHFRRIFHLRQPLGLHLKHADFIRGTKPVLGRPEDPIAHVLIPFKVEDAIHHVLQNLWSCNGALLIDMPDHKHRNILAFGQLHQRHSTSLYLGHAAGRTIQLWIIKGLNRVNDQDIRLFLLHGIQYIRKTGFRQHQQLSMER